MAAPSSTSSPSILAALSTLFPPGTAIASEIARGRFGVVNKMQCVLLKRSYAVKASITADTGIDASTALNERAVMIGTTGHHHVVRLLYSKFAGGVQYLVMELAHGSWVDLGEEMGALPMAERVAVAERHFHHSLSALSFLHSIPLVHRDIKPNNFLVRRRRNGSFADGITLVADFGYSSGSRGMRFLSGLTLFGSPHRLHHIAGTPLPAEEDGGKSDVFSAAISAMAIVRGVEDFMGPSATFPGPQHLGNSSCRAFAAHRIPVVKAWIAACKDSFEHTAIICGATFDQQLRPNAASLCADFGIDASPVPSPSSSSNREARIARVVESYGYSVDVVTSLATPSGEYSSTNVMDFLLEEIRMG